MLVASQAVHPSGSGSAGPAVAEQVLLDGGDRAQHPRVVAARGTRSTGRTSSEASTSVVSSCWTNDATVVSYPRSRTSACTVSRRSRQVSTGPGRSNSSTARTARSNAAHTIACEGETPLRPRISHSPWSFWRQPRQAVDQGALQRPGVRVGVTGDLPGPLEGDHHLAIDVELALERRAVADTDRSAAGVPRRVPRG